MKCDKHPVAEHTCRSRAMWAPAPLAIVIVAAALSACGSSSTFVPPSPPAKLFCDGTQAGIVDAAVLAGARLAHDAYTYYDTMFDPSYAKHRKWFDAQATDYYIVEAKQRYALIEKGFNSNYTVACDGDQAEPDRRPCDPKSPFNAGKKPEDLYVAFVKSSDQDTLRLCPERFFAPDRLDSDPDGRPEATLHEQSHRMKYGSTNDVAAEMTAALALATDPDKSTSNSYSYQYFAWDRPLSKGCSVARGSPPGNSDFLVLVTLWLLSGMRRRRSGMKTKPPGGTPSLSRRTTSALALAVALASGCVHAPTRTKTSFPPADIPVPPRAMVCALSITPTELASGAPIRVTMTIYNRSKYNLRFLPSHTPLAKRAGPVPFDITKDGQEVPYTGDRFTLGRRQAPPAASDYLAIPAWGALSGSVEIKDYDVAQPGTYLIGWDGFVGDVRQEGAPLPPPKLEPMRMVCTPAMVGGPVSSSPGR